MVEVSEGASSRRLLRRAGWGSSIKLGTDLLTRSLGFILSILIARHLGAAGFGRYAVLWYAAWMAAQISDLGLHVVAVRDLSQGRVRLATITKAKLAMTCVSLALVVAAVGPAAGPHLQAGLLLYAAALAASWNEFLGAALRASGRPGLEATVLGLLRAGWLAGVAVALAWGGDLVDIGRALSVTGLAALLCSIGLARGRIRLGEGGSYLGPFPWIRAAVPLMATSVITLVYLRLDLLILATLEGTEAAGLFGASFRFLEGLFVFSGGIAAGAFPLLAAEAAGRRMNELARFVLRLLLGVAVPAGVSFLLLAEPLVGVVYGKGFEGAVRPLQILAFAVIPLFVNALTTHLLVATGRTWLLVKLMCLRLLAGVATDLVAIPVMGAAGAALAVVTGEAALALGAFWATRPLLMRRNLPFSGVLARRDGPELIA